MSQNTPSSAAGFFNQEMADAYDRRNAGLRPISDCLHFLMRLVLASLPGQARVLCVGVGTGAEIFSLAAERPGWSFVGVDPSSEMLDVARHRLNEAGQLAGVKDRPAVLKSDTPLPEGFEVALR